MQLVIFDVDGTLTDTNEVDSICFQLAFQHEFGLSEISCNWENYSHTTDQGIAIEILTSIFSRPPLPHEIELARTRFLWELRRACQFDREYFRGISGSADILQYLQEETDWKVAIATGCWADSAFFKLQQAGIQIHFPFGSSEDSISRDEIVQCSIEKAKIYYNCTSITSVVFVGDGVWDVKTAQNLGIGFIGVSTDEKRQSLEAAGARFLCSDFNLSSGFLNHLNEFKCYESN